MNNVNDIATTNESTLSIGLEKLKQKQEEIYNISEGMAKEIEKQIILIIKTTASELKNNEMAEPIAKFKVMFDQCADESEPTIGYSITLKPKEKMQTEKFFGFSNQFMKEETKDLIGKERIQLALKIKRELQPIMGERFMVDILIDHLWYNHITVDLTK